MNNIREFKGSPFFKQAELMLLAMSSVAREKSFAVKGGTAINLFLRDMPRLSVDIDLTYLPIEPRAQSLKNITEGLKRIAIQIEKNIPQASVLRSTTPPPLRQISKLIVQRQGVKIKIEPNWIVRGTVFPPKQCDLTKSAEKLFELFVSANTLSLADLYGGKICAALDRQHPRDLFDIKILLENEGITEEIRKAFVVYLAGHDRPMNELLDPQMKDTNSVFQNEFLGMARIPVSYNVLQYTLKTLVKNLRKGLSNAERQFLISVKEGSPKWKLFGIPGIDQLPAIQWK